MDLLSRVGHEFCNLGDALQEYRPETLPQMITLFDNAVKLGLNDITLTHNSLGLATSEVVKGDSHRYATRTFLYRADMKHTVGMILL
jgi:hypothetical protein